MAVALSALATRMTATSAATATALASGTTAAEVLALAAILTVLSKREDLMDQIFRLAPLATVVGAGAVNPG